MSIQRSVILISCFIVMSCQNNNNLTVDDIKSNQDSADSKTESIQVLSYKQPCSGVMQRLCLLVVAGDDNEPVLFYDDIAGFDFVWGHAYELTIKKYEIVNPAADASSYKYELDAIVSDSEDVLGASYNYKWKELHQFNGFVARESADYYFLDQPFECGNRESCDQLVASVNAGDPVNMIFEYIGEGKIKLHQWN